MRLIMCDICTRTTQEIDIRYVTLTNANDKLVAPRLEICVYCMEKIKAELELMKETSKK